MCKLSFLITKAIQYNFPKFLLTLMAPIINLKLVKKSPVKTAPCEHLPEHNTEMVDTHMEEQLHHLK